MYLLRIVNVRTGLKLMPVEGQTDEEGNAIDSALYCQGATAIRDLLGEGAIVYTPKLINRGKYYQSDGVYCCEEDKAKEHSLELAPEEGIKLYRDYIAKHGKGAPVTSFASKSPKDSKITKSVDDKSFLGTLMRSRSLKVPKFEDTGFHIEPETFYLLARNVKRNIPTMLYGQSGTGKTELVQLLAEAMDIPIEIFDMGSALDPTATLVGVHRLEDGASVFDYSRFYHAIQQPCIILLDELSRAPENTTNLLLPCLDSRRTLYTDVGSSKVAREVSVHEDCVFIATANVGNEYVGVNLLDKALLSRFFKIELDYPISTVEENILMQRTGIGKADAQTITAICQDIRGSYAKGVLSKDVSLRESLTAAEMVSDGFPLEDALKLTLLPNYEGGLEGGERMAVLAKITGR